jgi:hypothetical protein
MSQVQEVAGRLTLEIGEVATKFAFDKACSKRNDKFAAAQEFSIVN